MDQLIFTDVPRGKGRDPALPGYQVKACSSGLTDSEIDALSAIAKHYGGAVRTHATPAALAREDEWRRHTDSLDSMPEEILNEFPEIVEYLRLNDDRYALSRIRYTGFTHDGRPGNFLMHSLAFDPAQLTLAEGNAGSLARSGVRVSVYEADATELERLPDPPSGMTRVDMEPLKKCRAQVGALIQAFAGSSRRTVLLYMADWRESAALIESVLETLPPATRWRTTFCTWESQRKWTGSEQKGGIRVVHHVLALPLPPGGAPDLLPSEYEHTAVFRFDGKAIDSHVTPGKYAQTAGEYVLANDRQALAMLHALVSRLNCQTVPEAWDAIAEAIILESTGNASGAAVAQAATALVNIAKSPTQAQTACDLLVPHLRRMVAHREISFLDAVSQNWATLAERIGPEGGVGEARQLVIAALERGNPRTAMIVVRAFGLRSDAILRDLSPLPTCGGIVSQEENSALVDMLLEILRATHKPQGVTVLTLMAAAEKCGRSAEIWKTVGDRMTRDLVKAADTSFGASFIDGAIAAMPGNAEAQFSLRMLRVESVSTNGDRLLDELAGLGPNAARCDNPGKALNDVVALIRNRVPEGRRAEAFLRVAETGGPGVVEERCFGEYRRLLEPFSQMRQFEIRNQLARHGVARCLCREFLGDVLSLDRDHGRDLVQRWCSELFANAPAALDQVFQDVALKLNQASSGTLRVAEGLLSSELGVYSNGRNRLFEAAVMALPLESQPQEWLKLFERAPAALSSQARARLSAMQFVARLSASVEGAGLDWSIETFNENEVAWRTMAELNDRDRHRVIAGLMNTFADTGIATSAQARKLVQLLDAAGESTVERIADAVWSIIENRDEVSLVLVAAAFGKAFLESRSSDRCGRIMALLAGRFDRSTRKLLHGHLERGFSRRPERFGDRLQELYDLAGTIHPPPQLSPDPEQRTADASAGAGASVKGILQRLWRSSESEKK